MAMKILIYGINFSPELTGTGKYSGEMAGWLVDQGHDVHVITAPPYYPKWAITEGYKNRYSRTVEGHLDILRCPLFVPSKPTGLSRLVHLMSFSLTSFFPVLGAGLWKPDVVIQVAPTLFCSIQALILSRLTGALSLVHIQDYEVDAMVGLSVVNGGIIRGLAFWLERHILNRFDLVSTISKGMMDRAAAKGISKEKLVFFPNWSEIERFKDVKKNNKFLLELGIEPQKKIVLYSGNMGEKQGLDMVVRTAKRMEAKTEIQFIFVGQGADKSRLEKISEALALKNLIFLPLQPYEKLPDLLASADCHLVVQKSGAADAVLPSKLTNILAVGGNAVITASTDTTLGALCRDFEGIGTLVEPESITALEDGIITALKMPQPNSIAQQYAQKFLDKDRVLNQFLNDLKKKG